MKKLVIRFGLLFSLIFISTVSFAQEVQIAFDEAGKYLSITPQIESRAKLFTEYAQFREANLFQVSGDSYVLEVSYLKDGKLVRDRKPLTKADFDDLRLRFNNSPLYQSQTRKLNQEGRALFLTTTTTWSASYYGYMIPASLSLSQRQTVGTWMLLTGASFYIPFISTQDSEISMASAQATLYGATRSIFHAAAIYHVLTPSGGGTFEGFTLTAAGLSLAEMYGGFQYAKNTKMSSGRAQAIGLFTDYGTVGSYLLAGALTGEANKLTSAASLIGTGLGLYAGIHQTKDETKSEGDVRLMYATTYVSGYALASIANLATNRNQRVMSGAAAVGAGLGLYYGSTIAKEYDFSKSQGTYIAYSTVAGLATGIGAAYSFFGDFSTSNSQPYAILSSLGAIGGYYVMFNYLKDDARILKDEETASNISFHVDPISFASYVGSNGKGFVLPGNWVRLQVSF